ncbi:MAG: hypothetical protein AAFQ58_19100 [Pseudomonadota bacterium]
MTITRSQPSRHVREQDLRNKRDRYVLAGCGGALLLLFLVWLIHITDLPDKAMTCPAGECCFSTGC